MPTETISVGTKPFENLASTEVRSMPQFCFRPDVYNSSASGYGWHSASPFTNVERALKDTLERHCQLGEEGTSPQPILPTHLLAHSVLLRAEQQAVTLCS